MEFKEILTFADGVMYDKTGKHLNDLQRDILEETLQGQKYSKIADKHDCQIEYVREVASELWKALSEELGEKVRKSNLRTTLERASYSIISSDLSHSQNHFNYCENGSKLSQPNQVSYPDIDLDDAPILNLFYGRENELKTLQDWIITEKTRLITIYGLSGIGKTTLTLKLIETIQNHFNYIIYRSLDNFANLDELLEDLISVFVKNETQKTQVKTQQRILIKYLKKYKCLLILDNGQVLFQNKELAGTYKPNYQEFSSFFLKLGQTKHQSCLILNTWDLPNEVQSLANHSTSGRILPLEGLGKASQAFFESQELKDPEKWQELSKIYQGNPQWLEWVTIMINELWDCEINQYWQYEQIIIPEPLKISLEIQLQRLTLLEQQILTYISQASQPVTLPQLVSQFKHSPTEVFNAIQSLKKRCLIEKNKCFTTYPVIKQHFTVKKE